MIQLLAKINKKEKLIKNQRSKAQKQAMITLQGMAE